ncbi:hypothetical protein [Clavibacter zhangzhiyongii]|uniref:hypothetical protein n=1 Tax=Clavibacter TaxID=1573 RepID=UPI0039DF636F
MDPIYTTETMATRALAAEIRHDPTAFTFWIEKRINANGLGSITNVKCEGEEKTDVIISYDSGLRIGIEAKFDHEITDKQLTGERSSVDHLVLLVLERADALGFEGQVTAVATWRELLSVFSSTRLRQDDIDQMPATKKMIERRMHALVLKDQLPEGWSAKVKRGARGMSAIVIEGPTIDGKRALCGQIQVTGQDSKRSLEQVTLEYHVGVGVGLKDADFPKNPRQRPSWIADLELLHGILIANPSDFEVRQTPPRNGSKKNIWGPRKMPIVHQHLRGREWLAQGYCNWSLGAKSTIRHLDDLETLAKEAVALFLAWQRVR